MKIDAPRVQKVFLILAVVLLVVSLFLPAVQGRYGKDPVLVPGWGAMVFSLLAGFGTLDDALTRIASFKPRYLLPFLAALSNLNFIVTGVCLMRRRGKGGLPRWLLPAALCGLILAIVSPFALQYGEIVRPGFYVWLLAHACLVATVVSPATRITRPIDKEPMKKYAIAASLLTLAGFAGLASAQEVVRIGHSAAVTGPVSYFGKDTENGARMAIEALNARGVVIGGKKVRFELVAEDDGGDPKQATNVAQKLVDGRVNGVVGHETSGTTIPASKIYNQAGIPQISPSSTSPVYTKQGFNTAFRVVANDVQLGQALGHYAVQKMNARRVAVIDDRTAYGQGLVTEFSKGLRDQGATVVAREFTHDKASDFNAILTKIRAAKPDLVFFGGMSAVAGPMLRQMKQLGMNVKMMGGDGICSDEIHKLSGGAMADGQVFCAEAGGVDAAGKPAMDKFRADYKKRFGIDVQINAPYAYDAVMTMAEAMVKAGSSVPARYLPVLARIETKGVTGPIAFDARGDIRDGTITLYTFKGGRRTILAVTK